MITKLQVMEQPKLINEFIVDHIKDYENQKYSISTLVKNDFKNKLHPSTIDKHIKPEYKNHKKAEAGKKAKHKISAKSRILSLIKNTTENEFVSIASGLNEVLKRVDKNS